MWIQFLYGEVRNDLIKKTRSIDRQCWIERKKDYKGTRSLRRASSFFFFPIFFFFLFFLSLPPFSYFFFFSHPSDDASGNAPTKISYYLNRINDWTKDDGLLRIKQVKSKETCFYTAAYIRSNAFCPLYIYIYFIYIYIHTCTDDPPSR